MAAPQGVLYLRKNQLPIRGVFLQLMCMVNRLEFGAPMTKLNRRVFLKRSGAIAVASVAALSGFNWIINDYDNLEVVEKTIRIEGLGNGLDGFKIVQLSDFHFIPLTRPYLIKKAISLTNQLKPDLVVLTGDFIWHELEAIYDLAPLLTGINARLGTQAILGNHDHWLNAKVISTELKKVGIDVLFNEVRTISMGGDSLQVIGVDDGWSGKPDLMGSLGAMDNKIPGILLWHEPDLADQVPQDGRVALQLSGHSHGGQVRLPGKGALILPYLGTKYDCGLYRFERMYLYTNRGIGIISVPFRFNCRPEITSFILSST
jgi:predicted MPP superfamily phosphohydrolase